MKYIFGIVFCLLVLQSSSFAQQSILRLNWKLAAKNDVAESPGEVSRPGFKTDGWINAVVPGTVFYAYVIAGKEKNPDYADNIYQVDHSKYNRPFWYRTEFSAKELSADQRIWLNFEGVNKWADVYLNGHHLGTLKGLMQRGIYDITNFINRNKENAIAVLVSPPLDDPEHHHGLANWASPTYICSASWDWMPAVPGLNSGITEGVSITTSGAVKVEDPWIRTQLPNNKLAKLTINAALNNASAKTVNGVVKVTINPGNISISGPEISLKAHSRKRINYNDNSFSQLIIKNPNLWWPNGYGGKADGTQNMYTCTVSFEVDGKTKSDAVTKNFGIRKICSDTTSLNGPLRVYVNNVPILIKGGNWGMSDYMLKVRGKDYETRIRFHKEMNYNMIRNWTGEVTDEAFYDYCDKYGIMVWDDFWLNNMGPVDSVGIFKDNAIEKVKKFRDHPSIVIWCGANEGVPGGSPTSSLSEAIKYAINEFDGNDRIYLPRSNAGVTNPNFSIHGGSHNLSGSGIWGNVDPKTYFTDPHNGYLFSNKSYGLRSELGTATFVNIESFKKFMPKDYWVAPTPEAVDSKTNMWAKHYFSTDGGLGGGSQPVKYINDINKSYGKVTSLEDFCKKAQLLNLETTKAMYEAWNDHMWKDASGMLLWMSQSAYPTMIWQTYDYYYDLTGAYFGSKQVCEPVHIQWNAATNSVKVINNKPYALQGLIAEAAVFNMDGKPVANYQQKTKIDVNSTSAKEAFVLNLGDKNSMLSNVRFLKLKLFSADKKLLSENFYWIGNQYLDYTALDKMPAVSIDLHASKPIISTAINGINKLLTYSITNQSKKTAAFGIRAQLLDNKGEQILPAIFSDGYFSLMQGEKKTLTVEIDPKILGNHYVLNLKAYNN